MYWLYFALFIFATFIPVSVQNELYIFNLAQTQQLAALSIGLIGFTIFFFQEKNLRRRLKEGVVVKKQVNQMTKDLTSSYSYIGEVNRKLDIIEQVALSYPESHELTIKKQKAMYDSIMEAIRLLGKSNEFSLRFICVSKKEVLKEMRSMQDLAIGFSCKNSNAAAQFFESDEFIMTTSPKAIDDIISCIIIKKKNPNQKIDDLEILKSIASLSLLFFMFIKNKKQNSCTKNKSL